MHLGVVFAVIFLALLSIGSALECYHCGSTESMAMCMKNKFVKECQPWEDRCYKVLVDTYYDDTRITRYTRGCSTDKQCYEKSMNDCRGGDKKDNHLTCDVYCCSGYLCNVATIPAISRIILMTCAAFAVLLY